MRDQTTSNYSPPTRFSGFIKQSAESGCGCGDNLRFRRFYSLNGMSWDKVVDLWCLRWLTEQAISRFFFELQFHNRTIHRPFEVRSLQSGFVADSDFGYGNSSEGETFLYHRIVSALFESQSGSARSFTINFEAKHPKVHSLLAIFTSRSTLNQLQGKETNSKQFFACNSSRSVRCLFCFRFLVSSYG